MNIEIMSIPDSRIIIIILVSVTAAMIVAPVTLAIVAKIRKYRRRQLAVQAAQELYRNVMNIAGTLSRDLSDLVAHNIDPLDLIVQFFSLTSPVSDTIPFGIYEIEQYLTDEQKRTMNRICSVIGNMGRCDCGINRSKHGTSVNACDVYLGNLCGIWTNTVQYWKANRNHLTGIHKDTYYILQCQAKGFMQSNTGALQKVLCGKLAS